MGDASLNDKETIILIHGLSDTREIWSRQISCFQNTVNVIAYDVRGFGRSPTGAANGTVRQMADDLAQLLSAMQTGPVWLVGFSMGGVIAQQFALDFENSTKGIVLIASSNKVGRAGKEYFHQRMQQVTHGGLEALATLNAGDARGCLATDDEQMIAEYQRIRGGSVSDPEGYLNACRAMLGLEDEGFSEKISSIQCPALVIAGELDPYCPPKASELIAAAIPNAELKIISNVGHCLHWEANAITNGLIARFIGVNIKNC